MIDDESRQKLQNIVRGTRLQGATDRCSKIRNILIGSFGADPTVKSEFESRAIIKERQVDFLKSYAKETNLYLDSLPSGIEYIAQGGESKVYLSADKLNVIKANDAVYYATWTEYFDSLTIHNLLFPNTAYSLLGFIENGDSMFAVLQQPFIKGEQATLESIRELLTFNGFANTRRQDYFSKDFGLLLEDMHDENVIANGNLLFFIDTVFYIVGEPV